MKDYDENKQCSYLEINNLYRWAMWQKLCEEGLQWFENTSQLIGITNQEAEMINSTWNSNSV